MAVTTTSIDDLPQSTTTTQTATGLVSLVTRTDLQSSIATSPVASTSIMSQSTTSTSLVNCPCCQTIARLPILFGPNGKCPNAMDYTQPIEMTATIVFTRENWNEVGGTSMSDFCIPDSVSFPVICDRAGLNGNATNFLVFSSSYGACSSISAPATRFLPFNPSSSYFSIQYEGFTLRPQIVLLPRISLFDGNCGEIKLSAAWGGVIYLRQFDCSIPSFTFEPGRIQKDGRYAGTWSITFTP